jgi:hypothetical protein
MNTVLHHYLACLVTILHYIETVTLALYLLSLQVVDSLVTCSLLSLGLVYAESHEARTVAGVIAVSPYS